ITTHQAVAVKILLSALTTDTSFITRFTRETEALQKMRHPNIIRILDAGQDSAMLYYIMEYINGTTVGALLKQRTKIDVLQAIEVGAQVADALDYIHTTGKLIHRDIKPDNIMVDRWSRAKVLDFGLARIDGAYTITRAGMVVGSLYYVPPEHLRGERIDGRADIYALGVSLYEMVTGERPFRGKTLQEMSRAIAAGNPVPPSLIEPAVSLELEQIILKALARKRDDRYGRAGEMRDDLRRLQQNTIDSGEPALTQPLSTAPGAGPAFPQPLPPVSNVAPPPSRMPRYGPPPESGVSGVTPPEPRSPKEKET
ncbi:MAG TPA: protein kinase, partial [Ktedonobacterales bacterium]|nr:protein kinase [Ktedonobacterales bacterium]